MSISRCASAEFDIDFGDDVIVVGSSFKDAYGNTVRELNKIQELNSLTLLLSCSSVTQLTFVSQLIQAIKVTETERNLVDTRRVINKLAEEYESLIRMPTLEADDAIGIYATIVMMTALWCHLIRI